MRIRYLLLPFLFFVHFQILIANDSFYELDRRSFAPLCSRHFSDEKHTLIGTWLESCDETSINGVRAYLPLIPLCYEADCFRCASCGAVNLNRYNTIDYPIDDDYAFDRISELHTQISYGSFVNCDSTDHCEALCWDGGYFRQWNHKYFHFFKHYLHYCSENPTCDCHWPETSYYAVRTNDRVYSLLKSFAELELIDSRFSPYWMAKERLFKAKGFLWTLKGNVYTNGNIEYCPNSHGMASSLTTYTFFYSQYHSLLLEVASFIDDYGSYDMTSQAIDRIYQTLGFVSNQLLNNYNYCLNRHPHPRIYYERGMIHMHAGRIGKALEDVSTLIQLMSNNQLLDDRSFASSMYQQEGEAYANIGMYDKAISSLTQAIARDPHNKEAYFQRAAAYFETGSFDLALHDYLVSEKSKNRMPIKAQTSQEFSDAFMQGLAKGAKEGAINFFPSLFSAAYQITVHPVDTATHLANTCWDLMLATREYLKEVDWSRMEAPGEDLFLTTTGAFYEPALQKLYAQFDHLTDAEKGAVFGYAIGHFGMDFLAGGTILKGAKYGIACKRAREANQCFVLESLAVSEANAEAIAVAAAERITLRETLIHGTKAGRIVAKTPNAQFHIMQKKHAWDKLVNLTGNVEEDFKRVALLLEENSILSEEYFLRSQMFSQNKIIRSDYKKTINGFNIQAIFETHVETNQTFLQDAWVITK